MTISLKLLFEEIHQVKDEDGLRSHLAPKIGEYFAAKRSGIFLFDQLLAERTLQNVLSIVLSAWTATVRFARSATLEPQHQPFSTSRLTARELQIANLVALGRTNAEIGNELWITENSVKQALKRMFRKLGVSSRTAMVAQISTKQPYFLGNKPSPSSLVSNTHQ